MTICHGSKCQISQCKQGSSLAVSYTHLEIIREGLYRGADNGYLLTDRAFAGADTLATSYAIATAIRKIGEYVRRFYCKQKRRNHF